MHPQTLKSLANARDFMRASYETPLKLPDISAQANLSPYHFLRLHKEVFQESPREFLTRLRIERAKTLLARGEHNVTEACFEVGYSSLGSFSVLFARQVGLSPSEYRRYARPSVAVPKEIRSVYIPACFLSMLHGLSE